MKAIVLATDFSSNARRALKWAVLFARKMDSNLIVLNCYSMPHTGSGMLLDISDKLRLTAEAEMKKLKEAFDTDEDLQGEGNLKVEFLCENAPGVDGIINFTMREDVELLVLGTKGETALVETVMGSVTNAVISKSRVPVLAVPEYADDGVFDHIVIATEITENPTHAVAGGTAIASLWNAKVDVVTIVKEGSEINEVAQANFLQTMKTATKYDNVELHLVRSEEVGIGVTDFVHAQGADMLVMLRQRKNFWERLLQRSHTRKMVLHSKVPLLIYKDESA